MAIWFCDDKENTTLRFPDVTLVTPVGCESPNLDLVLLAFLSQRLPFLRGLWLPASALL